MWFNNALMYKYSQSENFNFETLFTEETLKPCPPHARFIFGWLPAYSDELVQEVAGAALFCLGKEERILPSGVIKKLLAERVAALEDQTGRVIKRAEKAQMAEDLEFELLPKSFCVQKRLPAFLDTQEQRLVINTASSTQASQLIALLKKTVPGLQLEPLTWPENLPSRFASWLSSPETLPPQFELARDCVLFSPDDENKKINCKGYELPAEEILTLLSQGLLVSELSLIWNERIQFTLTEDMTFKRLKSLDYLVDEFNDIGQLEEDYLRRDAALTLVAGELRQLYHDLVTGLTVNLCEKMGELEEAG